MAYSSLVKSSITTELYRENREMLAVHTAIRIDFSLSWPWVWSVGDVVRWQVRDEAGCTESFLGYG